MKQQPVAEQIAAMYNLYRRYQKTVVITTSVIILNFAFGFDPKFTIINLVWLLPLKNRK